MKNLELFLKESNAIEGVYDDDSLHQAKLAWEYLMTKEKLTPGVILKTHKILSLHSALFPDEKGYFRRCEVRIGSRYGLGWDLVPHAVEEWCLEANKEGADPIGFHVEYEQIHPFVDFNGRTGRLFMNWMQVKKLKKNLIVFTEKDRRNYYKLFR